MFQTPIERLQLSLRTLNCLKRARVNTVGDVLKLSQGDLLRIRNFGGQSLEELRERLREHGYPGPWTGP